MTKLQIQQRKFLLETCAHYNSRNRGVKPNHIPGGTGKCSYAAGCAIGRHLDPELAAALDTSDTSAVCEDEIFEQLPDHLQELGQNFLSAVQGLHDHEPNWDKKGLSPKGIDSRDEILQTYRLGDPPL